MITKILLQLIELTFSPSSLGNRFRKVTLIHRLSCLLHAFSRLFDLIASFLILLLLFGRLLIHCFTQFIDVSQHFALLVTQAFQFAFDLVLFFLSFRGAKFGFQLLQTFVQHLLSSSQFFQTIQNLQLLTLRRILFLLLLSLTFGFVAIAFVVQFKLVELLLRSTALPLALSLLRLRLLHFVFFCTHSHQPGKRGLFGRQSIGQFGILRVLFESREGIDSPRHVAFDTFGQLRHFSIGGRFFLHFLKLFDCLLLRFQNNLTIFHSLSGSFFSRTPFAQ